MVEFTQSSPDSVHNDGERHIPYITVFPNSTINKLYAWAKFQLPNGMIQEQLRCGVMSPPLAPKVSYIIIRYREPLIFHMLITCLHV